MFREEDTLIPKMMSVCFPIFNLTLVGVPSRKISVQDLDVAERVLKGASKILGGECLKMN